jgi:hypothetical protein
MSEAGEQPPSLTCENMSGFGRIFTMRFWRSRGPMNRVKV